MTPTVPLEPLFNEKVASKILDKTPNTLRHWRCRRIGPEYIKFGRSVRYSASSLEKFIEQSRVSTGQAA